MKIIIIYIEQPSGNTKLLELSTKEYVSFDQENDYRVLHVIVIHKHFTPLRKSGLRFTCALHLDWCANRLINEYGTEIFTQ